MQWTPVLFLCHRCPFESQPHTPRILEMEYQLAEQCRQFAREFGQVVLQSPAALFGLAFSGATDQPADTGGTSCSGYSSSAAGRKQGKCATRKKKPLSVLDFFCHFDLIRLSQSSTVGFNLRVNWNRPSVYPSFNFPSSVSPWTRQPANTKCPVEIIDVTIFFASAGLRIPACPRIDTRDCANLYVTFWIIYAFTHSFYSYLFINSKSEK